MMPIALSALLIGTVAGFALARRFVLRTLVALILVLVSLIFLVSSAAPEALPGNGYAIVIVAYLIAPPLAAGLFGGGVIAWLFRNRTKTV